MEVLLLTVALERMWTNHLRSTRRRIQRIMARTNNIVPVPRKEFNAYIGVLEKIAAYSGRGELISYNPALIDEFTQTSTALVDEIERRMTQVAADLTLIVQAMDDPERRSEVAEAIERMEKLFEQQ